MRRAILICCICAVLVPMVAGAQVRSDARSAPDAFFIGPAAPGNFQGLLSDVTVDPNNWCFDITGVKNTFAGGETAAQNHFWDDTKATDVQQYQVAWGIQKPSGDIVVLLDDVCAYDLSGFNVGDPVTFCCALFVPVPTGLNITVNWGGRVQGNGGKVLGPHGPITITP